MYCMYLNFGVSQGLVRLIEAIWLINEGTHCFSMVMIWLHALNKSVFKIVGGCHSQGDTQQARRDIDSVDRAL